MTQTRTNTVPNLPVPAGATTDGWVSLTTNDQPSAS